jgi:hypothetical protein
MEIRFQLTGEDLRACADRLETARRSRKLKPLDGLPLLAVGVAAVGLAALARSGAADWRALLLLTTAALFALASTALALWRSSGHGNPWAEPLAGDCGLYLTPAGLLLESERGTRFVPWLDILALEELPEHFLLYYQLDAALIVPKRTLPEGFPPQRFAERVRWLWRQHPGNQDRVLPGQSIPERRCLRFLKRLGATLKAGYCLAVFRRFDDSPARAACAATLAALLAWRLALSAVGDYAAALPDPRFDAYGLAEHGAGVVLFLLSGLAVGGLARNPGGTLRLLTLIAAAEWIASAAYRLAYEGLARLPDSALPGAPWALFVIWLAWNFAIVFRAAAAVYRPPAPAALFLASAFALGNWGVGFYLPDQDIFYAARDSEPARLARIDAEDVLYRQPRLLDEATAGLSPERPGIADLYFVGFAGEADEPVFSNEVGYAKDLFDRRFGTAGRSLALANSPGSIDRWPLATGHGLAAVLQAVARRMNLEEDVLFLFLTSHGTKDHRLSVEFRPLPLDDLPAAKLKELLDRSGIRNRIVVVSACYSGGFLDALKDERSLILTAASRDRPSFGCGVESEFTYFGQAFFVEALRQSRSFVEAFGLARLAIERRERAEGDLPSLPQLHLGKDIAPKLRELERRFEAPG